MSKHFINIRLRLIIIKERQILLMYDSVKDFYFYVGGKLEYGETIETAAQREVFEECGKDVTFTFKKILYIRDFIAPKIPEHSLELFILADINKYKELEGKRDWEFEGKKWLTWKDIHDLPANLYPQKLTSVLIADYEKGFPSQGTYIGDI